MELNKQEWSAFRLLLLKVIAGLLALHVVLQGIAVFGWPDNRIIVDIAYRFGVDNEASVPTWFAQGIALASAALAFFLARNATTHARRGAWRMISLVAVLISIDEVAAIHELVLQGLHIWADIDNLNVLNSAWLLVLPAIAAGAWFLLRTIYRGLAKPQRKQLTVAISVYLLGAVGVELLSSQVNKDTFAYKAFLTTLEEGLELIGLWLLFRSTSLAIQESQK